MPQPKILIADDDAAILDLLTMITRRGGFEPDTARDGVEAIRKIDANEYAVIFLDLMMPRLDGYEVIGHLRSKKQRPAVIAATAMTHAPLDPGVVHIVLRKPFDIDIAGALITEAALEISASRAQPEKGATRLGAPSG